MFEINNLCTAIKPNFKILNYYELEFYWQFKIITEQNIKHVFWGVTTKTLHIYSNLMQIGKMILLVRWHGRAICYIWGCTLHVADALHRQSCKISGIWSIHVKIISKCVLHRTVLCNKGLLHRTLSYLVWCCDSSCQAAVYRRTTIGSVQ